MSTIHKAVVYRCGPLSLPFEGLAAVAGQISIPIVGHADGMPWERQNASRRMKTQSSALCNLMFREMWYLRRRGVLHHGRLCSLPSLLLAEKLDPSDISSAIAQVCTASCAGADERRCQVILTMNTSGRTLLHSRSLRPAVLTDKVSSGSSFRQRIPVRRKYYRMFP